MKNNTAKNAASDKNNFEASLRAALTPSLIEQIGQTPTIGARFYSGVGHCLAKIGKLFGQGTEKQQGPDRMIIYSHGLPVPGNVATTLGECVHMQGTCHVEKQRLLLNHEYVHILQYRVWGWRFLPKYLFERIKARLRAKDPYYDNAFEKQALLVEGLLRQDPFLPDIWTLGETSQDKFDIH